MNQVRALRRLIICLLMLSGALPSQAQTDARSREVLATEEARTVALVKGDVAALRTILADDLTYVHASGKVDNKASFLAGIASGALRYVAWNPLQLQVRLEGGVAVVSGRYAVQAIDRRVQQAPLNVKVIVLSVYKKHAGRWQQMAWQSTKDVGLAEH